MQICVRENHAECSAITDFLVEAEKWGVCCSNGVTNHKGGIFTSVRVVCFFHQPINNSRNDSLKISKTNLFCRTF